MQDRERPQMVITGERTVPGIWHENYWFRRHEVVYETIARDLAGLRVLEAGSGEGYGADLLRRHGAQVTALDYDEYAVAHTRAAYPQTVAVRGNLVALPFADASFDAVISLQTIEHLWDQDAFVAECLRVAGPVAPVWISTPNTLTFPPGNIYHPRELDPDQMTGLLERHGRLERLVGLSHGPRLTDWEHHHGSIVDAQISGSPADWPSELADLVRSIRCSDFVDHDDRLESSLDLIATVRRR